MDLRDPSVINRIEKRLISYRIDVNNNDEQIS